MDLFSSQACSECVLDINSASLRDVRFNYDSGSIDLDTALSFYQNWVNVPVYMVFYRPDYHRTVGFNEARKMWEFECDYIAVELAKRGNRVYRRKIRKRFSKFYDLMSVAPAGDLLNGRSDRSNLLFCTLTYDVKRCDVRSAWSNIGSDLNRFLSSIKQQYGDIEVLRCFESFNKNDYPHIHLIVGLKDASLPVYRYRGKSDGKIHYRLSNDDFNRLSSYHHSFVKVEGVKSLGALNYILKYITKDLYLNDNYRTMSFLWLFEKRSYGLSRGFFDHVSECVDVSGLSQLDTSMSNSNTDFFNFTYLCNFVPYERPELSFFKILKPPDFEKYKIFGDCMTRSEIYGSVFKEHLNGDCQSET